MIAIVINYNFVIKMNMKEEQRVAIKFCFKLGKTASESYQMITQAYGQEALSKTTVFEWFSRFRAGGDSVKDLPRSGRPNTSTTQLHVQAVEQIIIQDRRFSLQHVAEEVGISFGSTQHIVTEILEYRKVCARWVPKILTQVHRFHRVLQCQQWNDLYRRYGDRFINSVVTCDECWFHHYDPEMKVQSMQWVRKGDPRPLKAGKSKSAGKVMHLVFFDSQGIIYDHIIPRHTTVNAEYYSEVLRGPFMQCMRQKRQLLLSSRWWFHQDNAPAHTAQVTLATLTELEIDILPHAPYSPDLAPCDFFLFPTIKQSIKGQHFNTDDEVNLEVTNSMNQISQHSFRNAFQSWTNRRQKCIHSEGEHFEG